MDSFAYIKSDFSSQKAALIQRVRSRYPGIWNDFLQGSFGTLFIDITSYALSTTAYTANRLAAENYIPSMQLRESAVRLGALVGYDLSGATPATVPCSATLAAPAVATVLLAAGTPVRTADAAALTFELLANYTIAAGDTTPLAVTATFNPQAGGVQNVAALVNLTAGSVNLVCLDAATDLRQFVQVGQLFRVAAGNPEYEIIAIEPAPGAPNYNQLVLGAPWAGDTEATTGQVIDRRVFFVQGQTQTQQFTAPAVPTAYSYNLTYPSVIDGSVNVAVNGVAWTEVNYLVNAQPSDPVYQVNTLATGETIVGFGDGLFGATLPAGATVVVTYRTGGGTSGNIASGGITTSITGQIISLSAPITVTVVNNQPGSGGLNPETVDQARANIPAFVQTNDRAVTLTDYETLATSYSSPAGQVRFARATVRTQNALLEGNVVVLYAWTTGVNNTLVPLTTALAAALQAYMQTKAVGTDYVLIADGDATEFPLACRFKATPGYDVGAVEDAVLSEASAYITSLAPGAPAVYSDLILQLAAVPGVLAINVATPDQDLQPPSDETVFSPAPARPLYDVAAVSAGAGTYTAQAPASPLAAWGVTAQLNGIPLAVTAAATPGYAVLAGPALDQTQESLLNLQTGQITFYTPGPVSSFQVGFVSVQGYSQTRTVDIYVGYTGDTSVATRQLIRANLRAWAAGLPVGATLFAVEVTGSPTSVVSAFDVVAAVDGVVEITQIALDAPANPNLRVDVSEFELVQLRNVYINNQLV